MLEGTSVTAARHGARTARILIVEDEQDIAGLIKHTLERNAEALVETASAGDEALRAIDRHPPDLVILDLNLPVLSGMEVCQVLRSRPATARIAVIMLTARASAPCCGAAPAMRSRR